jgi:hypothetical protein
LGIRTFLAGRVRSHDVDGHQLFDGNRNGKGAPGIEPVGINEILAGR